MSNQKLVVLMNNLVVLSKNIVKLRKELNDDHISFAMHAFDWATIAVAGELVKNRQAACKAISQRTGMHWITVRNHVMAGSFIEENKLDMTKIQYSAVCLMICYSSMSKATRLAGMSAVRRGAKGFQIRKILLTDKAIRELITNRRTSHVVPTNKKQLKLELQPIQNMANHLFGNGCSVVVYDQDGVPRVTYGEVPVTA